MKDKTKANNKYLHLVTYDRKVQFYKHKVANHQVYPAIQLG